MTTNDNKKTCFLANKKLVKTDLVLLQFGNVSIRENDEIIIKPSGIDMSTCEIEDMSVINLHSKILLSGKKPSTDTPTHLAIYQRYKSINSIIHTHSLFASAWAQAKRSIPCMGTTHADYWVKEIMVTRDLTEAEIANDYERSTGNIIIEKFDETQADVLENPGILVSSHGPFTWGKTVEDALRNAELLEYIARMTWMTLQLSPKASPISRVLHKRHFFRKHGTNAYYGQNNQ